MKKEYWWASSFNQKWKQIWVLKRAKDRIIVWFKDNPKKSENIFHEVCHVNIPPQNAIFSLVFTLRNCTSEGLGLVGWTEKMER
mmetsp:Transcript_25203/g.33457  ORF Transcript_25203/g.33457 Transcript_25203/m.33457 type:complete len:84 (-) Transcript_25203:401-652(-)